MLSVISKLAITYTSENPKMLDIGSGYGDVTADILTLKPNSHAFLMDFSDKMIRLSHDRFDKNPNVHIIKHILNEDILGAISERKFNSVVSCFALHHIEFEKRVGLYSSIREILKTDGLFVNGDLFKCESVIDQWEFDTRIESILCRMHNQMGIEKSFDEFKKPESNTKKEWVISQGQSGICKMICDRPDSDMLIVYGNPGVVQFLLL
ncbi:MAG: class I SAM-dependent methyltransferase [Methanoregula sp.]|jgi:ubiquinone/menaquinone biosynthesis C-methylase UbiE